MEGVQQMRCTKKIDRAQRHACVSRPRLVGLRLVAAVSGVLAAAAASAQAGAPRSDTAASLEEVVVTAQRREENLQETPITLSVLSSEDLARNATRDIADLSGRVPGLVIGGKLTGGGNQAISLRGVTGQTVLTGADTAVSVYIDGVYLSKPDAAFFTLADVERIEILRGPQGTLYGRNATAGAINIITRTPSSDAWQGSIDANYGNYGGYDARGYLGGPVGGGFSASVSVAAAGHDGYFRDFVTGSRENGQDSRTIRGKLRYATADGAFDAVLSYDRTSEDNDVAYFHFGYGTAATFQYFGVSNPDTTFVDWSDFNGGENLSQGASLTLNYRPSQQWTLTSVTGWRKLSVDTLYSVTPPGGFPAVGGQRVQSINHSDYGPAVSQELRAVYDGERVKATVGATYFQEDVRSHFGGGVRPMSAPIADLFTIATAPIVETDVKSYAAFAQVDWEFIDRFTATFGLRSNHEEREMFEVFPAVAGQPTLRSTVKDDKIIPKLGLSFQANDRLMFYASASEGYQAPGQSYSAIPPPAGRILEVEPEKLIAFEGGIKSEWLDGRLRVNATAFHYDYDPLQVRVTTGLNQFRIVNATAKIDGFEMDLAAAVTPDLVLTANVLALDAAYDEFCDSPIPFDRPTDCQLPGTAGGNNGVSRKGDPLNQAPDWQFNLGFNYRRAMQNGLTMTLDGSYSYQSEVYFVPGANRYARGEPLGRANLRVGVTLRNGVELYAFGRNLTDDQSQMGIIYTALVGNVLDAGQITPPRTFGAGLRYSF
jgi:iron complex outermembrane receptor protein